MPAAAILAPVSSAFPLHGQIRICDPSTVIQCDDRYNTLGTGNGSLSLTTEDLAGGGACQGLERVKKIEPYGEILILRKIQRLSDLQKSLFRQVALIWP